MKSRGNETTRDRQLIGRILTFHVPFLMRLITTRRGSCCHKLWVSSKSLNPSQKWTNS